MGARGDPDDLIDLIYDTAVDPDLWPRVLERFADLVAGDGAMLMWQHQLTGEGFGVTTRFDPLAPKLFFDHFAARNPLRPPEDLVRASLRNFVPRVITDEDRIPKTTLMHTEFYNDFMRPFDMHSTLSVGLATEGMTGATVDVTRPRRRGPFNAEDVALSRRLQPHFVRAFSLGRRLAHTRGLGGDLAEALDRSPRGVFLVDADSRIRHLNRAADALIAGELGLYVLCGRLMASPADANNKLGALIGAAAAAERERRTGGSMPLASPARRLPLSVSVTPVRAERFAIFRDKPTVMVCVTDLEAPVMLSARQLGELFGLSRAETRVAMALYEGLDPGEAAGRLCLSVHTVRGHLARIFDKTGARGQVELIRLMMRAT